MSHEEGQTGILFYSLGYKLLGTLFLARGRQARPTALLLHGIPGIEKNYDLAHALRSFGWNALIFHYRGCWGSEGAYSIATIPADVCAALDCLTEVQYPQIDADRLFVIGHSLGGWAAVLAAGHDARIKALASIAGVLVVEKFPLSDPEYAGLYTPWLSGIQAEELAAQWRALGEDHNPIHMAPSLHPIPMLLVHGERDREVATQHTLEFSAALPFEHVLDIVPGADHGFTWQRDWLRARLLDWCASLAW